VKWAGHRKSFDPSSIIIMRAILAPVYSVFDFPGGVPPDSSPGPATTDIDAMIGPQTQGSSQRTFPRRITGSSPRFVAAPEHLHSHSLSNLGGSVHLARETASAPSRLH
jgi:hypothetical protein